MGRVATRSCGLRAGPGRGPGWGGDLWAEGALTPPRSVSASPSIPPQPLPGPGPPRLRPGPFPGVPYSSIEHPAHAVPCASGGSTVPRAWATRSSVYEPVLRRVRRGEVQTRTEEQPSGLGRPGAETVAAAGVRGGSPVCRGLRKAVRGVFALAAARGAGSPASVPTLGHLGPSPSPRKGLIYGPWLISRGR